MPPYISDFLVIQSPEYKQGYEEGFRDARRVAVRELEQVLRELRKLEPYTTATATTSTVESEPVKGEEWQKMV